MYVTDCFIWHNNAIAHVFNLEVANLHNFFVGDSRVLVDNGKKNNSDCGKDPKPKQYKMLSKGEILLLHRAVIDPDDLKPHSDYELYKDSDRNIFLMLNKAHGEPDSTYKHQ